jgi:hypothetical protein
VIVRDGSRIYQRLKGMRGVERGSRLDPWQGRE